MEISHNAAYSELKSLYEELQNHLDSIIVGPEDEGLICQCEVLGEKIYAYHRDIIRNNSDKHLTEQGSIKQLIEHAKEAKKELKDAENQLKTLAQVAKVLDKVMQQLTKIL